ncbi:MAG: response regulator transcription factor [Verrucomicrobia bacterium]|nr:response regulator transcription factor [Verrucomicrobiota bacterium]
MNFNGKVLIVDDEAHIRKYVSLILRTLGAPVIIEAGNGRDGFEAYQREQPDLVLMDVNMPVQDGLETLKQIRAHDPEAVVIMLTSLASRQVIEEAAQHGAVFYLRKDTSRDEIVTQLRAILGEIFETGDPSPSAP